MSSSIGVPEPSSRKSPEADAVADAAGGWRHERKALPTREQIDAITDLPALKALEDEAEAARIKIEVDLDFRPGNEEWASRARGALTAHEICLKNLRRRIHLLSGKRQANIEADAILKTAKAAKKAATLEHAQIAADGAKAKAEKLKAAAYEKGVALLQRTSWLAQFHRAAGQLLDGATMSRLSNATEKALLQQLRSELGQMEGAPATSRDAKGSGAGDSGMNPSPPPHKAERRAL